MAAPIKSTPSQVVDAGRPAAAENQGSYPEEITPEQSAWLQERATERRRRWKEHADSLAGKQKS
jgi:Spy/CpxP family protein refolding chaperone